MGDASAQPVGDLGGGLEVAIRKQQPELLFTDTSEEIAGAQLGAPGGGGRFEQSVSGWVTVGVVELFEVIQVEDRDRQLLAVARGVGEVSFPGAAVGKPGEPVSLRLVG